MWAIFRAVTIRFQIYRGPKMEMYQDAPHTPIVSGCQQSPEDNV